jgi:hypothetical protein
MIFVVASCWVSTLAYPTCLGLKGFVVVVAFSPVIQGPVMWFFCWAHLSLQIFFFLVQSSISV